MPSTMFSSHSIDCLSVVDLGLHKIEHNTSDFYAACYGQALLVHKARMSHNGVVRVSDCNNKHTCTSECTMVDIKFTLFHNYSQSTVHVCVHTPNWICLLCHAEKKASSTSQRVKGVLCQNLYVCEKTENYHLCGVGQCEGPKVSTSDGWVCQLTGLIVASNCQDPLPYNGSGTLPYTFPKKAKHVQIKSYQNLKDTAWFSERSSSVTRKELFLELLRQRQKRMMIIVPLILSVPDHNICTCRKKETILCLGETYMKVNKNSKTKIHKLQVQLSRSRCIHCDTMHIDHLTLAQIVNVYTYTFAEWHLRLTIMSGNKKTNKMKEANFALAAFYACKRGMTLHQTCILQQDMFLQSYLRNPAKVAHHREASPRGWYTKHRFSQVAKQLSRWIFEIESINQKIKACVCAPITTLSYHCDIKDLKNSLFDCFENHLRTTTIFTSGNVGTSWKTPRLMGSVG